MDALSEAVKKNKEITDKLTESVKPIIEQQQSLQNLTDSIKPIIPVKVVQPPTVSVMNSLYDSSLGLNFHHHIPQFI